MRSFNWKKTALVVTDIGLAVYLFLAVTAFNRPDEQHDMCRDVKINIQQGTVQGFLNKDDIKRKLLQAKLYPVGVQMERVSTRRIEEALLRSPFIEQAECYKTQTGHVIISLTQRMPVIRIKADNGDDYYIDEHGSVMPDSRFASDLAVATGSISKKYAQTRLHEMGLFLLQHPLWRSQVEQVNVLPDGSMEIIPRVGDHIVYLGQPTNLEYKFSRLEKFYRYGLSKAGWNKYSRISLEFDNQIICERKPSPFHQ